MGESVRHARIVLVLLIMGIGLTGAYVGVHGQGPRLPWPPPPIRPPDNFEESEPPPPRPARACAPAHHAARSKLAASARLRGACRI